MQNWTRISMVGRKGKRWLIPALLVALMTGEGASLALAADGSAADAGTDNSSDRVILKEQAQQYAKLFEKGDVANLTQMWDKDGIYVDLTGNLYRGRAAIQQQLAAFFKTNGPQTLDLKVQSIDFPSSDTAIECGITKLRDVSAAPWSRYTALHIKRGGQWQMVNVTESPYNEVEQTASLKDLSFLIGDWSADGPKGRLHMKGEWLANNNVIRCTFDVDSPGGSKSSVTQFFFVDRRLNTIRSWQYDSDGGIGIATWKHDNNTWIADTRSIQGSGLPGYAINTIIPADDQTFTWQSTHRYLAGRSLPDSPRLTIKRDKGAS